MRLLRSLCLIGLTSLVSAPLASAQDYDRRVDESYREQQRGYGQYGQPPWAGDERVAADAHRLSQRAARLAQIVRNTEGNSYLADQAMQLSQAAERFHATVESPASSQQAMQAYLDLQQQYYDTRSALFRANRGRELDRLSDDWAQLAGSYEHLALSMGVQENLVCSAPQRGRGPQYGQINPQYQYGYPGRQP